MYNTGTTEPIGWEYICQFAKCLEGASVSSHCEALHLTSGCLCLLCCHGACICRSKQTCCYIDLFNVSKLTRVREALTTDLLTQDAAVYKDVKVSVNLNVDEADATITSPNRDGNKSEIECYQ